MLHQRTRNPHRQKSVKENLKDNKGKYQGRVSQVESATEKDFKRDVELACFPLVGQCYWLN